jgi:hypothetical protein
MGVGGTLYRSFNPVHGFVLNVFRARARAPARTRSMRAIVPTPYGQPAWRAGRMRLDCEKLSCIRTVRLRARAPSVEAD